MNSLVILPLVLCIVQASATDKQDVKPKPTSSPVNTIQQSPKYEMIYEPLKLQQPAQQLHQHLQLQTLQQYQPVAHLQQVPQYQQKPQYVPIQIIPKPYYVQQPQPQAMIIIAQPALVPQSLVYGSPTQQLLNYFHSNPQAKYQFLHGNYQQPQQAQPQHQQQQVQPTATYMHPVIASPVGNYILTTAPQVATQVAPQIAPQHQLVAQASPAPVQYTTQQAQPQQAQALVQHSHAQQQPQLNSLAQLAQLAAQQYIATQMKTAPAIVTGFEHFTPEQQAQIKAQLSSHLGSGFHAVSNAAPNQYSSKYVAEQENNGNFVPSPQIKTEVESNAGAQNAELLKTRFVKTKN